MKTHAPTPTPARNTTRVGPSDKGVTRQFKAGDSSSRPDIATQERYPLDAGNIHRDEYAAENAKGHAAMAVEIARLGREQAVDGGTGIDASNPQGGVGDYLSNDA